MLNCALRREVIPHVSPLFTPPAQSFTLSFPVTMLSLLVISCLLSRFLSASSFLRLPLSDLGGPLSSCPKPAHFSCLLLCSILKACQSSFRGLSGVAGEAPRTLYLLPHCPSVQSRTLASTLPPPPSFHLLQSLLRNILLAFQEKRPNLSGNKRDRMKRVRNEEGEREGEWV